MTKTRSCTCEIRTKLVGDGCEICNPEKALEYAKETIAELRSQLTARDALLRAVRGGLICTRQAPHAYDANHSCGICGSDHAWIKDQIDDLMENANG